MERSLPLPVSMPEPPLDDSLQVPRFPTPSAPTQIMSIPIASSHNSLLSPSSGSTSPGYLSPPASFDGTTTGVQTSSTSLTCSQKSFSTDGTRMDPRPPSSNPSPRLAPAIPSGQGSITDSSVEGGPS
ncbi:hypothetical protein OF83DRAFT_1179352 [Amylostereum chailletii]|nr:hypothetical protein OF83DRAFT_1179352 [Amylostereum chailletii]